MTNLSLKEIETLGELLAESPEPFVPMEADMLDGFLCALSLMNKPPEIHDWIPYVYDVNGNAKKFKAPALLRKLVLARGRELEETILAKKPIDPILYDEEVENPFSPLAPFADGFAFAASLWPELLENKSRAIQAALVGILRYQTKDEEDSVTSSVLTALNSEVRFASLDEALADVAACVIEIAEATRGI